MLGISRATLYRKLKRYNIGGGPASAIRSGPRATRCSSTKKSTLRNPQGA